jgi:nitrate reductase alpha subunit
VQQNGKLIPDRMLRASDFAGALGESNNPEWKTVAYDETSGEIVAPTGSVGFRWGEKGKWNLEEKESTGRDTRLRLSLAEINDEFADVGFPYFGNLEHDHFTGTNHDSVLLRRVPVKKVQLAEGEALVASVYDLFLANYGVDRGFGGANVATSYDENEPYTPAWAEKITGVPRDQIITVAREFALNAEKTHGRSMVIIGAAMNHWYHMDMNYRGVINMLVMCGCVGQSGGGWSHYVGQEKLRPQSGWTPLAFALDASRTGRRSSMRTRTSGATRRSTSAKSCRPPRLRGHGTAPSSTTTCVPSAWAGFPRHRSSRPIRSRSPRKPPQEGKSPRTMSPRRSNRES